MKIGVIADTQVRLPTILNLPPALPTGRRPIDSPLLQSILMDEIVRSGQNGPQIFGIISGYGGGDQDTG
jgi:hypothetical protein